MLLLKASKQCPRDLLNAFSVGRDVYDVLSIVQSLCSSGSCSVYLCSCAAGELCVLKSYRKSRLDARELSQVRGPPFAPAFYVLKVSSFLCGAAAYHEHLFC